MENKLNEILSDLQNILYALNDLAKQLALDMNKVEEYIDGINAKDAISIIKTHYDQESTNSLAYFAALRSKDADKNKDLIQTFVENINGAWDIQNQITVIHDTVVSTLGGTKGLLELWTEEFLLKGPVSDDTLMNYYKTLERYFAALLFYQFKGANLVVEAQNYVTSSTAQTGVTKWASDGDSSPAHIYLTETFQPLIKEELDEFMRCVVELIVNNCGLYWENHFLPDNAQAILARATFFGIQTMDEAKYGLRAGILGTGNLAEESSSATVDAGGWAYDFSAEARIDVDAPNRAYDAWGTLEQPDLKAVSKDTTYNLQEFNYSSLNLAVGSYPFSYEGYNYTNPSYTAEVKKYSKDYIEDSDGDITYGYVLGPIRAGGKEIMMDPSAFHKNQFSVHTSGPVHYGEDHNLNSSLYLKTWGSNKYSNDASHISVKLEYSHNFKYTGTESTKAYLNVAGSAKGSVYFNNQNTWDQSCHIDVTVGIIDSTHGKKISSITHGKHASDVNKKQSWSHTFDDHLSFTLEPGVSYYVYANVTGYGTNDSGSYQYEVEVTFTHISLTFVSSEY